MTRDEALGLWGPAALPMLLLTLFVFPVRARGQTYVILHEFDQTASGPEGPLVLATDGNFYGTTAGGGQYSTGTIFRMDPAGNVTIIHSFDGYDGSYPMGGLIQAADGYLYGTTRYGGTLGHGNVFKLDLAGNFTALHNFTGTGSDGIDPYAGVIEASDGNLYGTTNLGGQYGLGTVFKMDPSGNVTTLYSFSGADGSWPRGRLIQASDGNLYSTTNSGGNSGGCGTVFEIDFAGNLTVLHSFGCQGPGGSDPTAGVIQASDGYLYGTTDSGGTVDYGATYRIDFLGNFTTIHSFNGTTDGASPFAGLIQANDGNFYGSASTGGSNLYGSLYEMDTAGNLTALHDFPTSAGDGGSPDSSPIEAYGELYGVALGGSLQPYGIVYRLDNCLPPLASSNSPLCQGQTLQLAAYPSSGATYSWSGPNGFASTLQAPSIPNVMPVNAGTYSVTVTDGACTPTQGTVNVVVNSTAPPAPAITPGGPINLCLGGNVTLDAGTGYTSYLWSPGGQTSQTIGIATSGSYTVTVSNGSCSATSAPVAVTVNPLPTPSITPSGPTTFCAGGSVTLDAGAGYAAYLWSPGGATTQTIAATASGSYTVTVTDGNGCQGTSAPTVVTVNPNPAPVITVSHCLTPNTSGQTASAPANAGDTYNWTITGGTIDSGQGTDTISFTSGGPATLMTLNVTETTVSGCTGNAGDTMQVNFNNVPASNPFYTFICTIARHAITAGCGGGNFCPANLVLRSQMAVFLLRGEHGSVYVPPPAVGIFGDVPASNPFAPWIEELYNEQITGGCSTNPLDYCPGSAVTRASMAVFLLVAEHGAGYTPPACVGIFTDVACPGPFTNWIEELDIEGITGGCSTNPPAYCPADPVTRAQMSVFLTVTFNLP